MRALRTVAGGRLVLLLEPDRKTRTLMEEFVGRAGFRVQSHRRTRDLVDAFGRLGAGTAARDWPSIVVMDVGLDEAAELGALRALRDARARAAKRGDTLVAARIGAIDVVVVSGSLTAGLSDALRGSGVLAVLAKPVDAAELLGSLSRSVAASGNPMGDGAA